MRWLIKACLFFLCQIQFFTIVSNTDSCILNCALLWVRKLCLLEAIEGSWMEGNMIKTGVKLDEKLPLYEKVAGETSFLIEPGAFRPGDKVSSIRNLT